MRVTGPGRRRPDPGSPAKPYSGRRCASSAEETGLVVADRDLRALDLSGRWVRFGLDMPAGTNARVDPEHDRLDWLSLDEAIARCQPATVADGLRLAAAATTATLAFRPLRLADVPELLTWQHSSHAIRWFPERLDLAAAHRKYGPRIAGDSPVRVHVVAADGQDCGYIQHYRTGDVDPPAPDPDAIGLDFAIGVEELTGRGLGPQLIWSYMRDVVLPNAPGRPPRRGEPRPGQYPLHPRASKVWLRDRRQRAWPGDALRP